ncbi:MAG: type 1 glutamine amidotransferase [Elusimicrobia bacterium]|nr:type 1 glutamine amidotransferase [Elusimicrobiota bacterium]
MSIKTKRAVIITGPNFQDEEYVYPYYRFLEDGFNLDVAIKDKAVVHGKYGVPAKPTMDTKDLQENNYDVVFLPGGHEAPDRVRQDPNVLRFVREMSEKKKIVAAICHGPWIMISAKIVKGRKITAYEGIKDDVLNAGADYVNADVVVDDNFVTSPHYRNNGDFMREVLKKFNG